MKTETKIASLVIFSILLTSIPTIGTSGLPSPSLVSESAPASFSQVTRDVEFILGKSFDFENTVTHPDFAERSASNIVDQIDDFLPEGLEKVTDVDVYNTEVSISITQLHVIEDQEFLGPGSIYFNFLLNRDHASHEYRDDNDGSYYVTDDNTYLDVDILLTDYLLSMDGLFTVEIHGWEWDPVIGWPDDYLGGGLLSYNLAGYTSRSISGWLPLNYYPPIGGINHDLQIEVYLELEFTNIEQLLYPTDFGSPNDGSWLISAVYFPKVYYFELGNTPLIQHVYEQVYYGYDESIGANAYLIYYLFYWEYELEFLGFLGHNYDYEPLLMYVEEIGQEPYRIVFPNLGVNGLPSEIVIQDASEVPRSGSFETEVSTPLMPLLGNQSTVDYRFTDIYFNTPDYHYETDHGLTPLMTVPKITVKNAFHQMQVGVPPLSGEAVLSPLQDYLLPMTNEVIREGYSRLDEAFDSEINVYEAVNIVGGGDYTVPYNMSLTLDMLHNPFKFPYIVDCWEDIVHYTEAKQEYEENGLYYDIDLGLSFTVPATVTFNIPTQVTTGQTYDIGIDLALDAEDITISFAYDIYLGYVLHWWFIGFEESVTYSGQCDFAVNLNDISEFISFIGLSTEDLTGDYQGGWITVTDFSTSTDLLGTLLDCNVEIHLLRILSDLLGVTVVGKLIDLLKIFLSDVDLIVSPSLSGYVTADLVAENSAISLDTSDLTFSEGSTHKTVQMVVVGGSAQSGISLSNMQYNVEFSTDWAVELDFSDIMNYFVADATFFIGTFPTITLSSDDHELSALTTTGYDQQLSMSIVEQSSGTTSPTSSNTQPPDGGILLLLGAAAGVGIVIAVVLILIRKKS